MANHIQYLVPRGRHESGRRLEESSTDVDNSCLMSSKTTEPMLTPTVESVSHSVMCLMMDDLLISSIQRRENLEIVDSSSSFCCFVPGLTEQVVTSSQDVLRLVEKGYLMRNATGCLKELPKKLTLISHAQPLQQYRPHCSHAVFTFKIEHLRRGENEVYTSQISLVDLSGQGIEQLHSDTSNHNFDSGIDVLHKVLATSSEKGFSAASSLHSKSSLTKLLKHSLGGKLSNIVYREHLS